MTEHCSSKRHCTVTKQSCVPADQSVETSGQRVSHRPEMCVVRIIARSPSCGRRASSDHHSRTASGRIASYLHRSDVDLQRSATAFALHLFMSRGYTPASEPFQSLTPSAAGNCIVIPNNSAR